MATAQTAVQQMTAKAGQKPSLIQKIADRYSVEGNKLMHTLKMTAFQTQNEISNEQMMALLIVADQYHLNPFTKEIYAFPDKQNGIVPVVGVDGWSRIINENKNFDGMEFDYAEKQVTPTGGKECPEWIECVMYRKDRDKPIKVREYLDEVYRAPFKPRDKDYTIDGPWQSHTKRMLRHKVMIQCARIAFGFTGIYDQDEAERIIEGQYTVDDAERAAEQQAQLTDKSATRTSSVAEKLRARAGREVDAEFIEPKTTNAEEVPAATTEQ